LKSPSGGEPPRPRQGPAGSRDPSDPPPPQGPQGPPGREPADL